MKIGIFIALAALCHGVEAMAQQEKKVVIDVQSYFSPLMITDAPKGGAHPVGGPAHIFIMNANLNLSPLGTNLRFHATDDVKSFDAEFIRPAIANIPEDFDSIHHAVAAGPADGGVSAGIGLSIMNGDEASKLFVAGLPFGLRPAEYAAYLYKGGGLALQQDIYDEVFGETLKVIPIAITPAQGGGWFPDELPSTMKAVCQKPWIVRWPSLPSGVWIDACKSSGVTANQLDADTRCADSEKFCPSEGNPIIHDVETLSFGGFKPGALPHKLSLLGQVDAFELNLPYTDVMMMKVALGIEGKTNDAADLSPIVDKTPYLYLNAWHQPLSYIELVVNRDVWDGLSDETRSAIQMAAKASVLESWTIGLDRQGDGIAILRHNGAKIRQWPQPLLNSLKAATNSHLDQRAKELQPDDGGRFARVLTHMRDYQKRHQTYFQHAEQPLALSESDRLP